MDIGRGFEGSRPKGSVDFSDPGSTFPCESVLEFRDHLEAGSSGLN